MQGEASKSAEGGEIPCALWPAKLRRTLSEKLQFLQQSKAFGGHAGIALRRAAAED